LQHHGGSLKKYNMPVELVTMVIRMDMNLRNIKIQVWN
jgi:hypothetical protein